MNAAINNLTALSRTNEMPLLNEIRPKNAEVAIEMNVDRK
jgi:hypothetical protein